MAGNFDAAESCWSIDIDFILDFIFDAELLFESSKYL